MAALQGIISLFKVDLETDTYNNLQKLKQHIETIDKLNLDYYKWYIVYLFMFIYNLLIQANSNGSLIDLVQKKSKIKGKGFTLDLEIQSEQKEYEIREKKIIVNDRLKKESVEKIIDELSRQHRRLTYDEIKIAYIRACSLMSFDDLCNALNQQHYLSFDDDKLIEIDSETGEALLVLRYVRNSFVHFSFQQWLIDSNTFKKAIISSLSFALTIIKCREKHFKTYHEEYTREIENLIALHH